MVYHNAGMDEYAERFPSELSGGQKQRTSVARSLVNDPGIILADEPVGNLDSKSSHNVMEILEELNEKDKKTIILVTHETDTANHAKRIIRVKDGSIISDDKVEKRTIAEADTDLVK
jgi:putative ABC transport system ATP-binding protein